MMFSYYMPTQFMIGKGIVRQQARALKDMGTRALIVTGKYSAKKNGALDDILYVLNEAEIEAIIFDEIEENPSLENVEKAAILGKRAKVDFVIGIGGGSPLDAAKAIGVMIKNPELTAETLITTDKLESLNIVAIPTTSGTGSETTQYAILTDHGMKTKRNLGQTVFPKLSLLDPTYTMFMPNGVTLATAIDALTHLIESYLSTKANPMSDMLVESGLSLWGECIEGLKNKVFTYEIREKLMLASTIAGMAIANTGTSLPHGMGYYLTYYKGVPHGIANGVLYKGYLQVFKSQDKINSIVKKLGLNTKEELIQLLADWSQIDIGITEDEIKEWTREMMENKAKLANHPENIGEEDIYYIFAQGLLG